MAPRNTVCLWYDGTALDAAQFYAATFPDSAVGAVMHAPGDYPDGSKGDVLTVEFTVAGVPCVGLNGGPRFRPNEAFSFQIATDDQPETDRLWNAIVGNGGEASACGWCKDKWGISWQITPRALLAALKDPDREAARRAFDAMMMMGRIDIAGIEAACGARFVARASGRCPTKPRRILPSPARRRMQLRSTQRPPFAILLTSARGGRLHIGDEVVVLD